MYYVGAYALAQAYFAARARGTSSDDFWSSLATRLQTEGGIDTEAVEAFLSTDLDLPGFYSQQVDQGSVYGTPFLALTATDVSVHEYKLRAVQHELFRADSTCATGGFTFRSDIDDVPFVLVCGSAGDPASRSFVECGVADGGSFDDTAATPLVLNSSVLATPETERDLNLYPIGSDPYPAWVWVAANGALIPGHVPDAGRGEDHHATWGDARRLIGCDDSSSPYCGTDTDGDGYPVLGDCDDSSASIKPDDTADALDGTGTDYNCDAWRTSRP